MSKLKRFCEKCGKELIYIKLPKGKLATCEWEGPVPFVADDEKHEDKYLVAGGKIVSGYDALPDFISGYGYKVHRCET